MSSLLSPWKLSLRQLCEARHQIVPRVSEVELQRKLNQPRVVARRGDTPEIAGIDDLPGVLINAATG